MILLPVGLTGMALQGLGEASWSLVIHVDREDGIPARHRLRKIGQVFTDVVLDSRDGVVAAIYPDYGCPSIAPERLIRASLIQMLFSMRSQRLLMEQMQYYQMSRVLVVLGFDDPIWVPAVFTKIRDRLLTA